MSSHTELKKGVKIIIDGNPCEILEARPLKMAQRRVVIQAKIRNLVTSNVFSQNFHQGDTFQEAELLKVEAKFLYFHRDRYFFSEKDNPQKRFDLMKEKIGSVSQFLKPNQVVEAIIFDDKVINIALPIKIRLEVTEAPPGIKGSRTQSGTKQITLKLELK